LNRRAVLVAGGLATAVILAAVFTLSERSRQVAERRDQTPGVSATPDRFWDGQSDGVPQIPMEFPEIVQEERSEPPILEAEATAVLLEGGDGAGETEQALRRALTSRPIVFEGRAQPAVTGPSVTASARARPVASGVQPFDVLQAASDLYDQDQGPEDALVAQNLQHEKREFLRTSRLASGDEVLADRVRPPLSPYEVKAGSLIPAVLVTQANSDLPGQLIGQVRENVYDSATGAHLLIPQGTRAIGVYDSLVAFGQERVLVAWQRLLFPDGSSLNLGSMPGTDLAGAAGFEDRVHRDYFRVFGGAILLSAISAGAQISQGTFGSGNQTTDSQDLREILAAALGQNLSELGSEMASRNMNVQPTLEIRAGYPFNIAVVKDLVMPGAYQAF
jgi:type IV secretory pathway VirB10-like protein